MLSERIRQELSERYQSDVQIDKLSVTLFPQASVTGEGVTFREHGRTDVPPLVHMRRFTASATFWGLLGKPTRIGQVKLEGLDLHIPPKGETHERKERQVSPFVLDSVIADDASFEMLSKVPGKEPKQFHISKLRLRSAGTERPLSFTATLTNPQPPGLIETSGEFGPWNAGEGAETPVSGKYTFRDADLSVFKGISGTLASDGTYAGVLNHIDVNGTSDTPNFALKKSGNRVALKASFHAVVDGTTGDTYLDPVNARFLRTVVTARGKVASTPGVNGKTVALDVTVANGRLEDLLRLAVSGKEPPMVGNTSFQAKLVIPPGKGPPIIQKMLLNGSFAITGARFTSFNVQKVLADISHRAQGEPREHGGDVASELRGHFDIRGGRASFSTLTFALPGAKILLTGSYGLERDELNFEGEARTDATLSQMTTGFKSLLLKAVDPFFRKQGAGAVIPFNVSGTRSDPHFGLAIGRRSGKLSRPSSQTPRAGRP